MCEFCTRHGEGKKWYLLMRNYSRELAEEELAPALRHMSGANTRVRWADEFFKGFVMPAMGALSTEAERPGTPPVGRVGKPPRSNARALARWQAVHFGQVLPIEDVEHVIDQADSITRMPCGCRFELTGKTDRRYCFGLGLDTLGILGKYPEASASLEVLDRAEAKKILRGFDDEGLIHSVWTGVTPFVIGLCNCDADCGAYRSYIVQGGAPSFFRAEYICQVDPDSCTGCKECMRQCQFGALLYSSALSRVYIDPVRCFGCGLCRAACAFEAISARPRAEHPLAAGLWLR